MIQSILFASSNTDTIKIAGKLEVVYSSNYTVATAQTSVQYFLKISVLKSVKLDLSKLSTQTWQGLVGKNIEIEVSKANVLSVTNRTQRDYVVLSIAYNPTVEKSTQKAKALVVDDAKKPWLNLLCKFSDIAIEPHTSAFYQTMFGNTYPYLEHYWKDTTYGHIDITGTQTINWVTLSHDHAYYKPAGADEANTNLLREECIVAGGGANILDGYYGVNLFFNGNISDTWAGLGGGGTTWIDLGAEDSLGVIAHEMGHAYGLPHSSGRYGSNYDSPWDVMSRSYIGDDYGEYRSIPQHTIAFHKQKLGAININAQWSNAQVDASAGEIISLSRLEENAIVGDYLIANISSNDGTKHYTIEARDKIGYDSPLPAKAVIIHEIEDGPFGFRAYILDPDNNGNLSDAGVQWQVGETFTDVANNISVEIVSSTATGYTIRITAPRVKPSEVTGITATKNLLEKVRVSWSPVQGAEFYKVLRYENWSLSSVHETFTLANNNTYYDDVPNDGQNYYYRVQACNSVGCSIIDQYSYGNGSRIRVNTLSASRNLEDKVHITWDAVNTATHYKILRYDSWSLTSAFQEFSTNNSSTSYDDVVNTFSTYYYRVKACNALGCSPLSVYDYSIGNRKFNISASDEVYLDKVEINFTTEASISTYTIYRTISGANQYSWITSGTESPLFDTTAKSSVVYDYTVSITYQNGDSIWITDGDKGSIGIDKDSDGDGVLDSKDAFPQDSRESIDTDADGIGNNADSDDDNDGLLDTVELRYGLNPLNASDASADFDNDGFSNSIEIKLGTDIRSALSKPSWAPILMDGGLIILAPVNLH